MDSWTPGHFDAVASCSQSLHGNKYALPVATAIVENDMSTILAPEIGRALRGHLAPNRVLEGLDRLSRMGVIRELPYPGRPHPRGFERLESSYWEFVQKFVKEHVSEQVS